MEVKLREIDRSTWLKCCNLKVASNQKSFVAPNTYSLAQAAYEPDTYPMGIFSDNELVGFLMWDFDGDEGVWEMCRLMVDEKHQGKGIGKAAVQKLLELVTNKIGPVLFYTSAEPENAEAIGLYEKLGFQKTGKVIGGEVVLAKQL